MGDLSPHFDRREFACKCGSAECDALEQPAPELLHVLELIRVEVDKRILVSSGIRCQLYDESLAMSEEHKDRKRREPGEHVRGVGADVVAVGSRARWEIVSAAVKAGVHRIGIGKDFIHIGVGGAAWDDPRVIWLY